MRHVFIGGVATSAVPLFLLFVVPSARGNNEIQFEEMLLKIETDTKLFAQHMEEIYASRICDIEANRECEGINYDACRSEFPVASCLSDQEWAIPDCVANTCGALFDFTTSSVRLASSTFGDPSIKDAICYSQRADEFIKQQYEENRAYWSTYGVSPPWYHFGTSSGVFRIFPARGQATCGSYDPTIRPWYVGASSGPKDVVLVLDTSGSMSKNGRLGAMKKAASRVIGTLGLQDYVAVVEFDSNANRLGNSQYLYRATAENKAQLINWVNDLKAKGDTNFIPAFQLAFEVLNNSVKENEVSAGCHQAILFLTDGMMTKGSADTLYNLIQDERTKFALDEQHKAPIIFSYSLGSGADDTIPKNIACQTNGIWSQVRDGDDDLAESMAGYYRYFAYGLGDDTNEEFLSWSEPYKFATNGELGTTASVPVYDRSVTPNLLVGVVGLDFSFAAMEKALGVEGTPGREAVLRRLSVKSVASCPALSLSECNIQSLRLLGGDRNRLCPNQCSDENSLSAVSLDSCDNRFFPDNVWGNLNNLERTFPEKVCCNATKEQIREPGQLSYEEIQQSQCSVSGASDKNYNMPNHYNNIIVLNCVVAVLGWFMLPAMF